MTVDSRHIVASACLQWAENIENLLNDTEGLKLFRSFLVQEYVTHPLDFYLACLGLRKSTQLTLDNERMRVFLKSLYRKYLRSNSECFVPISDETRRALQSQIVDKGLSDWQNAIEQAQEEVKALLKRSLYQQFLKSDQFMSHLQQFFSPLSGVEEQAGVVKSEDENASLPTLHEDTELRNEASLAAAELSDTEKSGKMLPPKQPVTTSLTSKPVNPYYISYYAAVSTIDSERASMSSEAANATVDVEFQASLTDSSIGGSYRQRLHERRHQRQATGSTSRRKQVHPHLAISGSFSDANHAPSTNSLPASGSARINSSFGAMPPPALPIGFNPNNSYQHNASMQSSASIRFGMLHHHQALPQNSEAQLKFQPFIPRGDRPSKLSNLAAESPQEFARILSTKLENVLAEREKEERIERCLRECANSNDVASLDDATSTSQSMSQSLGGKRSSLNKISSSLAKFVQSLQSTEQDEDTADEHAQSILEDHMSRVWDKTACIEQPQLAIQQVTAMSASHHGGLLLNHSNHQSPAMLGFGEPTPLAMSRSYHATTTPATAPRLTNFNGTPQSARLARSKITNPEILSVSSYDSGALPGLHNHTPLFHHQTSMPRQHLVIDPTGHFDSGISIADTESAKSLPPFSTTAKQKVLNWMMHNDKNGQTVQCTSVQGLQESFNMPPPPPPPVSQFHIPAGAQSDSDTQGSKRGPGSRTNRSKRSNESSSTKNLEGVETSSSTCGAPSTINNQSHEYTTVAYKFSDEEIPYRSQLPGRKVTLRHFKQLITKRGLFRFYFKTTTDEFPGGCVNEEVVEDDAVLPLYDGKIFARVERIEHPAAGSIGSGLP